MPVVRLVNPPTVLLLGDLVSFSMAHYITSTWPILCSFALGAITSACPALTNHSPEPNAFTSSRPAHCLWQLLTSFMAEWRGSCVYEDQHVCVCVWYGTANRKHIQGRTQQQSGYYCHRVLRVRVIQYLYVHWVIQYLYVHWVTQYLYVHWVTQYLYVHWVTQYLYVHCVKQYLYFHWVIRHLRIWAAA